MNSINKDSAKNLINEITIQLEQLTKELKHLQMLFDSSLSPLMRRWGSPHASEKDREEVLPAILSEIRKHPEYDLAYNDDGFYCSTTATFYRPSNCYWGQGWDIDDDIDDRKTAIAKGKESIATLNDYLANYSTIWGQIFNDMPDNTSENKIYNVSKFQYFDESLGFYKNYRDAKRKLSEIAEQHLNNELLRFDIKENTFSVCEVERIHGLTRVTPKITYGIKALTLQ